MFEVINSEDHKTEGFQRFCDNMRAKSPGNIPTGVHNLYLIQSVDKDGNITDEKYGMNLMTNYGFTQYYNTTASRNDNFYIQLGTGSRDPVITDTALESPALNSTVMSVTLSRARYPEYYDATKDLIIAPVRIGSAVFDYNISGVESDEVIKELGMRLNSSSGSLITRTLIFDSDGRKSSITKKVNERLTITIMFTISMKSSIISNLFDRNIFLVGGLYQFAYPRGDRQYYWSVLFTNSYGCGTVSGWRYNDSTNIPYRSRRVTDKTNGSGTAYDPFDGGLTDEGNNVYRSEMHMISPLLMQNQYDYFSIVIYGDNLSYGDSSTVQSQVSYFMIIEESDKLDTPETLVCYDVYTDNAETDSIALSFGKPFKDYITAGSGYDPYLYPQFVNNACCNYGILPCVDFDMQSSYMYNFQTDDWDIVDQFENKPDAYYNNSFIRPMNYWVRGPEGTGVNVWVWVNTRPDVRIAGFKSLNPVILAAADCYWDSSTWVTIPDYRSIPDDDRNLGKKRYYIRLSGDAVLLDPIRIQDVHRIKSTNEQYTLDVESMPVQAEVAYNESYKMVSSDTGGWIMTETTLIFPKRGATPKTYKIAENVSKAINGSSVPNDFIWHSNLRFATDDFIVVVHAGYCTFNRDNKDRSFQYQAVRVYHIESEDKQPTYKDLEYSFTDTDKTSNIRDVLYSWSSKGFLVGCRNTSSAVRVGFLKLYSDDDPDYTPSITMLPGRWAWALEGTSNMVYNDVDNTGHFHIYDMAHEEEIGSFDLPDGYEFSSVVGFSNFVYVRAANNGIYSTFLYKIADMQLVHLSEHPGLGLRYGSVPTNSSVYYQLGSYYGSDYPKICNDHMLIASGYFSSMSGSSANNCQCYVYSDKDPEHPYLLGDYLIDNYNYTSYSDGKHKLMLQIPSNAKLMFTKDQKHMLLLASATKDTNAYSIASYWAFDVGYIYNGHTMYGPPNYHWIQADSVADTQYHPPAYGSVTTFDNGIVVHQYSGSVTWYPIERWLAHKVTGTTRTIQSYNNPKNISGKRYKFWLSNKLDITEYNPTE